MTSITIESYFEITIGIVNVIKFFTRVAIVHMIASTIIFTIAIDADSNAYAYVNVNVNVNC